MHIYIYIYIYAFAQVLFSFGDSFIPSQYVDSRKETFPALVHLAEKETFPVLVHP